MVELVPHSGVPASSVHTGGSDETDGRVDKEGRVGKAGREDNVGNDGRVGSSDPSPGKAVEVDAPDVVVVFVDDAPALAAPTPIAPSDIEAPNSEAAIAR
ncbi:MAG: hypothetical protein WCA31_04385 [Acidimicrobiales bacterium]